MSFKKFIASVSLIAALLVMPFAANAEVSGNQAAAYQNGANVTVKGVVTDGQGEPLPGASVLVKGTTNGTTTDLDGNYTITVGANQTLVVSYIGFKDQDVAVNGKTQLNVALESDSTVLDDVVVVGYGTIKKANLTGAVDQVDSKVLENRPIANVQQMLSGLIPNLDASFADGKPARTTTFLVRGMGSIANINSSSDGNALVLIDGVEGDPELLNPNDIESVSVLKDAASAAIYGSRGPYGVILITTKDPAKNKDKVTVTYSANANWGVPTTIPDVITDGLEFAELAMQARYGYNGNYSLANLGSTQYFWDANGKASNIQQYVSDFKAWRAAGNTGNVDVDKAGKYHYYASEDWYSHLYKSSAFSQTHNLSVSGNAGKISYMISGRLYAYDGLYNYDPDTYKTNNLRAKISAPVFPWLKITENVEYTKDVLHQPVASATGVKSVFDATECFAAPESTITQRGFPTMPVYNDDGTLTKAGAYVFGSMIGKNAFVDVTKTTFRTTTGLEASFFDNHWRIKADYTYKQNYTDKFTKMTGSYYSEAKDVMSNLLTEEKLRQQFLSDLYTWKDRQDVNAYTEYENTWGRHYFKGMVGYNYNTYEKRSLKYAKRGLTDPTQSSYAFCQGEWVDGAFDGNPYKTNGITTKRYRNSGFFFRLNYSFADRYLLEVDGRYDGSSLFPIGRQWNFFPAVSAGWRVSQEPWWHVNPKAISNLKIRASYGSAGDNASIGPYNYQELFEVDYYKDKRVIEGNTNYSYFKYPGDVNSSFGWATITTTDVGLDVGFLNGKINITGDWYLRRTTDMLVEAANFPATFGSDAAKDNAASMSTRGWEVVATYNDQWMVGGKPFTFGFRGTIGDNYTIIDEYKNDTNSIDEWAFRSGQRAGEIWGYRTNPESPLFQTQDQINTAFNGKPYVNTLILTNSEKVAKPGDLWLLDLNGNGKIDKGENTADDPGDREIIGNVSARYNFSLGFNFGWNGIFVDATFTGVGHQDWSPVGKTLFWGLYGNNSRNMLKWTANNMWSPENPDALFPRLSAANKYFDSSYNHWSCYMNKYPVDRYIFNIGYIRLRNLQVGYNLPKKLVNRVNLSGVKVYFSGENLWNWSPFYKYTKDFDVLTINSHGDDPGNGISWSSGSVGQQYPMLKTFSFGVTITY